MVSSFPIFCVDFGLCLSTFSLKRILSTFLETWLCLKASFPLILYGQIGLKLEHKWRIMLMLHPTRRLKSESNQNEIRFWFESTISNLKQKIRSKGFDRPFESIISAQWSNHTVWGWRDKWSIYPSQLTIYKNILIFL